MPAKESRSFFLCIVLEIIGLLGIVTLALAAATLGTFNKHFDDLNQQVDILHQKLTNLSSKTSTTTLVTTEKTTSATAQTSAT
jgi:hypothetical protein